ncbi:MAG: tRNA pseudouridine(38-40) synthase TruA [Desulfobulbaceae bacterium]|jgi:tRNA pseudouridine38-40 synthase|nr:tRNA pseudouridine(38-40) synthase TruA [Desulfobulbaceae bacterium]
MDNPARNIRLDIAYDGGDYQGWQRQASAPTIQGEIEGRLSAITATQVTLHGAGRTDAGVHAVGMAANFHTHSAISCPQLKKALNSMLPSAIRIFDADNMDSDFHARFSSKGKCYRYYLQTVPVQSPFFRRYALHAPVALNFNRMQSCLDMLVGTHDFSSFENTGSRDKEAEHGRGAVRTLYTAQMRQYGQSTYAIELIGDGFLRGMVRNIVGTLVKAGENKIKPEDFAAILAAKDRAAAGPTAAARGLFLQKVFY